MTAGRLSTMTVKRTTLEGVALFTAGLVATADALRLIYFKNRNSVEDITGPGRYLIVVGVLMTIVGVTYAAVMWRIPENPSANPVEDRASDRMLILVIGVLSLYVL